MRRITIIAGAAVLAAGGAIGAAGLFARRAPSLPGRVTFSTPVWTERAWPFPKDPWGKGKAFHCRADRCGAEVNLYIRAKIGSCGCVTTIDDDDLDRVGDLDLIAAERTSLGPGRPVEVRWMKGRSRSYAVSGGATAKSAVAIAFHERCDMLVATAAVSGYQPAEQEPALIKFLNSDVVLRWAELSLGL